MIDLDAIRARNEEERRGAATYPHRGCEDTFYSCPMNPEYQGRESSIPENCDCDHDDRLQTIADVDALLAEVERLQKEVIALVRSRRYRPRCENCGYEFLHKSNFERHPCPPPPGYNFAEP